MRAIFYRINKKNNSTFQPTGEGLELDIKLKAPSSILNPVLEISFDITGYNYVFIPGFNRFYFINNINWLNGIWNAVCNVDVLASYKSAILSKSEYILRSASSSNGAIVDGYYPITADMSTSIAVGSPVYTLSGVFCVGVSGAGSALGISYYLFTPSNFRAFIDALMGNAFTDGNPFILSDQEGDITLGDGIVKSLVNPMQYIKSCFFIPINQDLFSNFGTAETRVKIGAWDTLGVSCRKLTGVSTLRMDQFSLTIPKHPQAASRGLFLNGHPFSFYRFLLEPFGMFELPACDIAEASSLYFRISVDVITGVGSLDIFMQPNELYIVAHKTEQIGIPISISQVTQNILGGLTGVGGNIIAGATNVLAGNVAGVAANLSGAIMSAINGLTPAVTSMGATGTFLSVTYRPELHARFANIAPEDNTHNGRPLCMEKTLSELSGFTVCDKPSISIDGALNDEIVRIENYLSNGFYIE